MKGAYVMNLGLVPFGEAWELQRSLAGASSQGAIPDTILFLRDLRAKLESWGESDY